MANCDRIQSTLWRRLRGVLGVPVAVLLAVAVPGTAAGQSRLKDIVEFEGVRDNMLVGYGLVVGLNGTGDNLANAPFTQQSLVGMLERLGVNTRDELKSLKTQNVAAVVVTATLPPFARQGTRIDVSASALGDANSLLGGTLLVTPMLGADGEVYAVAQGQLVVSGFSAKGNSQTVDLGTEFTNMIITQRAFSASTKIITTADEMLEELVRVKR